MGKGQSPFGVIAGTRAAAPAFRLFVSAFAIIVATGGWFVHHTTEAAPLKAGATGQTVLRRATTAGATVSRFVASPFASEFVVTGAEDGEPGEAYIPSHRDGTFGPLSNILGLGIVDGIDVADMDGDGDLDFVVCDGATGNVFLFDNRGKGRFVPRLVASGISTAFSSYLRIADFNGDDRPDFVVGDLRLELGMKVFLQTRAGKFTVGQRLDTSWNNAPGIQEGGPSVMGIAVGDLNGDGLSDIAMIGYEGNGAGEVRLYAGDGQGHFGSPQLLFDIEDAFGGNLLAIGLAAFDLENDGDLDLIVGAGSFPARLLYYVENLGGTLAPPTVVSALSGNTAGVGAPPIRNR